LPIFSFDIDEQENNTAISDDMVAEIPVIEQKEENVSHFSQVTAVVLSKLMLMFCDSMLFF
jgi:hypothetical protein